MNKDYVVCLSDKTTVFLLIHWFWTLRWRMTTTDVQVYTWCTPHWKGHTRTFLQCTHHPDGSLKNTVTTKIIHFKILYSDRSDLIVVVTLAVNTSGLLYDDFLWLISLRVHREVSSTQYFRMSLRITDHSDQFRFLTYLRGHSYPSLDSFVLVTVPPFSWNTSPWSSSSSSCNHPLLPCFHTTFRGTTSSRTERSQTFRETGGVPTLNFTIQTPSEQLSKLFWDGKSERMFSFTFERKFFLISDIGKNVLWSQFLYSEREEEAWCVSIHILWWRRVCVGHASYILLTLTLRRWY
jgi:hypothetical protein